MAKSKPNRKKVSNSRTTKELHAFKNIQYLLRDTIIGSVQIKENAQITKRNGRLLDVPTQTMANAFIHVKFYWKFLLGVVGRRENGTPYCQYEFVTVNSQSKLYEPELDELIFSDLRRMFKEANHDTRLTSFWIASPNPNMSEEDMLVVFYQLMDKYRVFDNMLTQYEIRTNKDVGRSLHETTYWYGICEFEELFYDSV